MQKLETFFFKYFSYATRNDENSWVRYALVAFFTIICACGIYCDVMGYENLAKVLFDSFLYLFTAFGILWIITWFYHKWRIRHER